MRIGSQNPRIKIEPERTGTDGKDAAELMAAYGYKLDPWQRDIVDCWLGYDDTRQYTTVSAGIALPRQNGKNVCIEAREFFGLVVNGERIMHTAHQVKTAKQSFHRLIAMFTNDDHPEVEAMVKTIRYTNGEETIELTNGGKIEYSARSRQSIRGYDGLSLIVFDEAQELNDDQLNAVLAILSASTTGIRQFIFAGTPTYPGCPGTVFPRRRKLAIESPGKHDAWHEWSVDDVTLDKIKIDNVDLWYQTNPALGIRLTEEFTAEEFRTLSPDGFARERLGWWSPVAQQAAALHAIDEKKWEACKSGGTKPEGKTAYGVKFTADGQTVVLCGAVIPRDGGKARISLINAKATSNGTRWLSDWLSARYDKASCVVIDGRNGVDLLVDRISEIWRMKGSIVRATPQIMVAAASLVIDGVNEGTLTWYDKQPAMEDSALNATRRPIAGGYGFGGDGSEIIEAASLALYGAKTSKRDPQRKMRIG